MNAHKRVLGSLLIVASGLGLMSPMTSAEPMVKDELSNSSIPAAMDYNNRLNTYYKEDSFLGDTKFLFGIQYSDRSIRKSVEQTEALYKDLMYQQDNDNPIVRTKDLPSPFNESIFSLQTPVDTNSFSMP